MNKLKQWVVELTNNVGKAFIYAFFFSIASNNSDFFFTLFGLPRFATEADNLSGGQVVLGLCLGIVVILISLLSLFFSLIFIISIVKFIYQRVVKPRASNKKKS